MTKKLGVCPTCSRRLAVRVTGTLYTHGPRAKRCDGSGQAPKVVSDLPDLRNTSLGALANAVKTGDAALEDALRRIAPIDGSRRLLVAASFNSAI